MKPWDQSYFKDGCEGCGNEDPLYLQALCHPASKLTSHIVIEYDDGQRALLEITCRECATLVGNVSIEMPSTDVQRLMLHHHDGLRTHLYFDGNLFVMCDECEKPVAIFEVKENS